jgi:hypothetical protein
MVPKAAAASGPCSRKRGWTLGQEKILTSSGLTALDYGYRKAEEFSGGPGGDGRIPESAYRDALGCWPRFIVDRES